MKPSSQKTIWIFLSIAIILGIIWQAYPLSDAKRRMDAIPMNGPGFQGENIAATPFEANFFQGVNMMKRVYKIEDKSYFVTILDGTHNRHVIHDPFYCIEGSGWKIVNEEPLHLKNGEANLVHIRKDGTAREVVFWFSDSNKRFTSPLSYWLQATLRRITLGWSGPEPLLIMIQPLDNKPVDWNKLVDVLDPVFKI